MTRRELSEVAPISRIAQILVLLCFNPLLATGAFACDYPPDYKFPTNMEILESATKQSAFAFQGIVTSSKLTSNKKEIEDGIYKMELSIRVLRKYFGSPPIFPVLYYIRELDLGAACSPLQPTAGHTYYFFSPVKCAGCETKSNVRAILEVDEFAPTGPLEKAILNTSSQN